MDEMTVFYWIGYFASTGIILCLGLFAWALFINLLRDLTNRTLNTFKAVYITALATNYLRKGEIKDADDWWWKATVSDDNKKITLELKEEE